MSVARQPASPDRLTYEQYLAEEETNRRYEIVDGERFFMTNPTRRRQEILLNIAEALRAYERVSRRGQTIIAPCDILIRRRPLQIRQPDVLFISHEQLAKSGADSDPAPLAAAPELVIEILSPSETRRIREEKLDDYGAVGVQKCWVVDPEAETIEVIRLRGKEREVIGAYGPGETLRSAVFPDLSVPVAAAFAR